MCKSHMTLTGNIKLWQLRSSWCSCSFTHIPNLFALFSDTHHCHTVNSTTTKKIQLWNIYIYKVGTIDYTKYKPIKVNTPVHHSDCLWVFPTKNMKEQSVLLAKQFDGYHHWGDHDQCVARIPKSVWNLRAKLSLVQRGLSSSEHLQLFCTVEEYSIFTSIIRLLTFWKRLNDIGERPKDTWKDRRHWKRPDDSNIRLAGPSPLITANKSKRNFQKFHQKGGRMMNSPMISLNWTWSSYGSMSQNRIWTSHVFVVGNSSHRKKKRNLKKERRFTGQSWVVPMKQWQCFILYIMYVCPC